MRGTKKISAAARLQTVLLYGELGEYTLVAKALKERYGVEIAPTSVGSRLHRENIRPGYDQKFFDAVVARLRKEVETEGLAGTNLPSRSDAGKKLTSAEIIETLEVFVEEHNYHATARKLGLDHNTVKDRLIGILGPERAHPAAAREKLAELKNQK